MKVNKFQKQTAVQHAIKNLRKFILHLNEEDKLPSEAKLASELGVSRLTVREALTVLEIEGYITKNQGSSTMVTTFARKLTGQIDRSGELGRFITESGYQVKVDCITYSWEPCTAEQGIALDISPGEELLVVEKRFLADSMPAAYCINRIPGRYMDQVEFSEENLDENIFTFLEENCDLTFSHDFMEIIPSMTDGKLSEFLDLKVNTPLLRFDITKYNLDGQPVMYNTEFYVHDLIKFTAARTTSYV